MSINFTEQLLLVSQTLRAGRFDEAQAICRRILAAEPGQADAWNYLGLIDSQLQQHDSAIDHFRRAAELRADVPSFHANLAELCRIRDRLPEAIAAYRRVLQLQPENVVALCGLGIVLRRLGQPSESIASFDNVLRLKPDSAEAHFNRALAFEDLNCFSDAVESLQEAVRAAPNSAELYSELGKAAKSAGMHQQSLDAFARAAELEPDRAEAHNNLGIAYKNQANFEKAVACYQCALAIKPDYAAAWNNLGNLYCRQARPAEAIAAYRQAIAAQPASADAYTNLADALLMQGATDQAIAALEMSLKLQPDSQRSCNILGTALNQQGRIDEAAAWLRKAVALNPSRPEAHGSLLCCLNYSSFDPAELLAEHRRAGTLHEWSVVRLPWPPNRLDPERPLRIGYVSPDFYHHPVAAFMQAALRCHDQERFRTFVYSDRAVADPVTQRLRNGVENWRDAFTWTDAELAMRVRADEIDILIELSGHTAQNRLGAVVLRPAPIQVSYLGYPSTTGLESIDYRLTDSIADPPGEPIHYTEHLWRLAPGFCCYTPVEELPPVSPLPGASNSEITLGSLHHLAKLNGQVLDLWAKLLHKLPECRLLISRNTLRGGAIDRLARELTDRGIAARRFELRPTMPASGSHLSLYDEIDVTLDVWPWSGHTTACESLWMGVPVVSLVGNRFAGRMVASVLTLAGLTQWIARTPEQYLEIVRQLIADRNQLAGLRRGLRARIASSPLSDGATFTRGLEDAYRGMWRRHCEQSVREGDDADPLQSP